MKIKILKLINKEYKKWKIKKWKKLKIKCKKLNKNIKIWALKIKLKT